MVIGNCHEHFPSNIQFFFFFFGFHFHFRSQFLPYLYLHLCVLVGGVCLAVVDFRNFIAWTICTSSSRSRSRSRSRVVFVKYSRYVKYKFDRFFFSSYRVYEVGLEPPRLQWTFIPFQFVTWISVVSDKFLISNFEMLSCNIFIPLSLNLFFFFCSVFVLRSSRVHISFFFCVILFRNIFLSWNGNQLLKVFQCIVTTNSFKCFFFQISILYSESSVSDTNNKFVQGVL